LEKQGNFDASVAADGADRSDNIRGKGDILLRLSTIFAIMLCAFKISVLALVSEIR
jgi:hypothetical protein